MQFRTIFFLFMLLTAASLAPAKAEVDSLQDVADHFHALYNSARFDSLVGLFHYPPAQPSQAHWEDSVVLCGFFQGMQRDWGELKGFERVRQPAPCIGFSLAMGDSAYWAGRKQFISRSFMAEFSVIGRKYVVLNFCNFGRYWQIERVQFGTQLDPGLTSRQRTIVEQKTSEAFSLMLAEILSKVKRP
jgi:hypothetical protein